MSTNKQPDDDQIYALIAEFIDLGRRAKSIKSSAKSSAKNEYNGIVQQIRRVTAEIIDRSQHMDPNNEHLQIFAAGAIIASALTENRKLEAALMALSIKVLNRAP